MTGEGAALGDTGGHSELGGGEWIRLDLFRLQFRHRVHWGGVGLHKGILAVILYWEGEKGLGWTCFVKFATGCAGGQVDWRSSQDFQRGRGTAGYLRGSVSERFRI